MRKNDDNELLEINLDEEERDTDPEKTILVVTGLVLIGSFFLVGGVLATGILTGVLMSVGALIVIFKLKSINGRIWNTILEYDFAADLGLTLSFALLAGAGTATGLVAASVGGIVASGTLKYFKQNLGKEINQETQEEYPIYKIPFLSKLNIR